MSHFWWPCESLGPRADKISLIFNTPPSSDRVKPVVTREHSLNTSLGRLFEPIFRNMKWNYCKENTRKIFHLSTRKLREKINLKISFWMIKNTNSMRILWEVSKVMQQCTSIHFWAKFKFTVLISIAPYLWSSLDSWNSRIDVWLSYQDWGVRLEGRGRGDEFRNRTAVSHYTSCAVFHSGNTVFTSLDEKCPWNFSLINFPHFIHFWLFFRQILWKWPARG